MTHTWTPATGNSRKAIAYRAWIERISERRTGLLTGKALPRGLEYTYNRYGGNLPNGLSC
jgi:hypothetical protein